MGAVGRSERHDLDMIDDWNISASWVREIRRQPWWQDHVVGGLWRTGSISTSAICRLRRSVAKGCLTICSAQRF